MGLESTLKAAAKVAFRGGAGGRDSPDSPSTFEELAALQRNSTRTPSLEAGLIFHKSESWSGQTFLPRMPLFGHSRSQSQAAPSSHSNNAPGAASGLFQAAQALGSIGAPSGNLRTATTGTTTAGTDAIYQQNPNAAQQNPLPSNHTSQASLSGAMAGQGGNEQKQYETPRRPQTYGRPSDDLHLGDSAGGQQQQRGMPPRDYQAGPPRINLEQSTPQKGGLPGTLQTGGSGRPPLSSSNTASSVHTLSSTNQDPFVTPLRSQAGSVSHSHSRSYSRSSPATGGYDGQYQPYTGGASGSETPQYSTPSSLKYVPGQQRNVSNTPLGLADIRPRADSSMTEAIPGANPYSFDGANGVPGNSNYLAPWAVYAFDWCKWPAHNNDAGKVAVGSYLEDGHNFIQILETSIRPQSPDPYDPSAPRVGVEFSKIAEATHSYPVTRLLWEPPSSQKQSTDLLATSGDHLRLWSLPADTPMSNQSNSITRSSNSGHPTPASKLTPLALLSNSKSPEHTAPLTSLDWNTVTPSLIITSSIDTTCTIWDIPTLTAKTQLIAHDKEVFDVRFCANSVDVFVSCGADGSVRMFDLRSLEHSTIIYEPTAKDDKDPNSNAGRLSPTTLQQTMHNAPPLLRLAASPHDTHLLATFCQDSKIIRILDVRQPGQALLELNGHQANVNCIEWSPNRRGTLASGGDDSTVLIWDLLNAGNGGGQNGVAGGVVGGQGAGEAKGNERGPTAAWICDYEVNNLSWAPNSGLSKDGSDWLGVSGGRGIWGVQM